MKLDNSKTWQRMMLFFTTAMFLVVTACDDKYPDLDDGLYAEFVTNKGTMVAKLEYDKAPVTVANFVALAEGVHPNVKDDYKNKRYYDGTVFHRVIDQFMIQGGDPTATGTGDPGYRFADEFHPDLMHDKPGVLSMANSGPGTNGSQFFITESPTPHLNNRHAVFGELVVGMDVLDSISNVETVERDKPAQDVVIEQLNIIRKGSDAKDFDAVKVYNEELPMVEQRQEVLRQEQMEKMQEEQNQREAANAEAGKAFVPQLEEYKAKTKETPTGLKYYMINEGSGDKPAEGSTVYINYEGYFEDGRLFDSNVGSVEERHGMFNPRKEEAGRYAPAPMVKSKDAQMIAGFKEAVAMLKVGDKGFFYLPSHLAYGQTGYGNGAIPPDTDLMFIVEMVEKP